MKKQADVLAEYFGMNIIQKERLTKKYDDFALHENFTVGMIRNFSKRVYEKVFSSSINILANVAVSKGSFKKWTKYNQIMETIQICERENRSVNDPVMTKLLEDANTIIKFLENNEHIFDESFKLNVGLNINIYVALCEVVFYQSIKMIRMFDFNLMDIKSQKEIKFSIDKNIKFRGGDLQVDTAVDKFIKMIKSAELKVLITRNLASVKKGEVVQEALGLAIAGTAMFFFVMWNLRNLVYYFFNIRTSVAKWSELQVRFLEITKEKYISRDSTKVDKINSLIQKFRSLKEFVEVNDDQVAKETEVEIKQMDKAVQQDTGLMQADNGVL